MPGLNGLVDLLEVGPPAAGASVPGPAVPAEAAG